MKGWISLHRKILDHPFYKERRTFSHYEAWIDLLILANYEDHEFRLGEETVLAHRGEVITSEVTLMERWRWSKAKVRWFLNILEKDQSIDRTTYPRKTKLFIKNYNGYQDSQTSNKPTNIPNYIPEKDTINKGIRNKGNKTSRILGKRETPFPLPDSDEEFHFDYGWSSEERAALMVDSWNIICTKEDVGLLEVTLTPERIALVEAKLTEIPGFLYEWANILGMIALRAPFLRGDNSRGWKADFDWVLQGDHWKMILDDKFLDPEGVIKAFLGEPRNQFVGDDPGDIPPGDGSQRRDPEVHEPQETRDDTLEESLSRDASESSEEILF